MTAGVWISGLLYPMSGFMRGNMGQRDANVEILDKAIFTMDAVLARNTFAALSELEVLAIAFDEEDPILYAAVVLNDRAQGLCAYVDDRNGLVTLGEQTCPPFLRCPPSIIERLDQTFDTKSLMWRRDCLMYHCRLMGIQAGLGLPLWTALYSEQPILQMGSAAHFAALVGRHDKGHSVAVTDGTSWQVVDKASLDASLVLEPLPGLEWNSTLNNLLPMKGRSVLNYLGLGPPEFRVGMLFNDRGGLLAWSGAASECHRLAALTGGAEESLSPAALLKQINQWLGLQTTV